MRSSNNKRKFYCIYKIAKTIKSFKEFIKPLGADVILQKIQYSNTKTFLFCLMLSWIYATGSQLIIPVPFGLVPITMQTLLFPCAALMFGWHAVYAYWLYYMQGALGLPFFTGFQGGPLKIFGPTGGYLLGFGLGMTFIASTNKFSGRLGILFRLIMFSVIQFSFGLLQLTLLIPTNNILEMGLYPFLIGDLIKISIAWLFTKKSN